MEDTPPELHLCLKSSIKSYPCLCFPSRYLSPVSVFTADSSNGLGRQSTLVGYASYASFRVALHTWSYMEKKPSPILSFQWFHLKIEFIGAQTLSATDNQTVPESSERQAESSTFTWNCTQHLWKKMNIRSKKNPKAIAAVCHRGKTRSQRENQALSKAGETKKARRCSW